MVSQISTVNSIKMEEIRFYKTIKRVSLNFRWKKKRQWKTAFVQLLEKEHLRIFDASIRQNIWRPSGQTVHSHGEKFPFVRSECQLHLPWLCPTNQTTAPSHPDASVTFSFGLHTRWSVLGLLPRFSPERKMMHQSVVCPTEVNVTIGIVTVYHVHGSEGFLHQGLSYVMRWDAANGFFQLEEKKNDASLFQKKKKERAMKVKVNLQLTFFSMPLKNCIMVMLAGGLDMPSTMQMVLSSWNTGLPDSWPFFSGLLTRIILEASSSDTRKAARHREEHLL